MFEFLNIKHSKLIQNSEFEIEIMSILGIDYGVKRVGLALAASPIDLPLPYKVIANKGEAALLAELKKIVEEERVSEAVVGWPLTESGELGREAAAVRRLVVSLRDQLSIKVETLDERYSSRLADQMSQEQGVPRDVGAAMIILDDYLKSLMIDK